MIYQTLPFTPTYGSSFAFKGDQLLNQFGDGYSQTAQNGLNANSASLNLEWAVLTNTEKESLCEGFFAVLAGATPFYYTPFGDNAARLWKCGQWVATPLSPTLWRVTATIKQSFDSDLIDYIPPGREIPLLKDSVTGLIYLLTTENGVVTLVPSSNSTTTTTYYLSDIANGNIYALSCSSGVLGLQNVGQSFAAQTVAYAVPDQITGATYQIVSDNGVLSAELM